MGKAKKNRPPDQVSLTPFLAPLQAVQALLGVFSERGIIIGGIAASLLGNPRFTADVDVLFLVEMDELPAC